MAIAQLSIDLVAKVASFERDLKRAADASVTQSNRMNQALSLVGGGLAGIAAGVSVGAIAGFVKSSIDAVDALNDLKDATGASIENLSALEYLAGSTGVEIGTVSTALVKFNAVLKDADPTKGPGAILKALGLSIEDLKRQDPAEAMRQVAVAFQGITNEGDRARVVQELFGKSVKEVAPFLKDLAENGALNAKVTTQQAEEAEKFNKQLFLLQTRAANAARTIAMALVPAINKIFDDVSTLGDKASLAGLASDVTGLAKELKSLQAIKVSAVFVPADIDKQIAEVAARLEAAKKKFNASAGIKPQRDILRGMDRDIPFKDVVLPDPAAGGSGFGGRSGTAADPYAEANRYLDSLRKQLQSTEELTVYEKLLADLRVGSLGKTTPAIEAQLKLTAQQIDQDKELAEITRQFADLNAQAAAKDKALAAEARGILEGTRTPLERLNIEQARLQDLLDKGSISADTFARASLDLEEQYRGNTDAVEELSSAAMKAGERIQENLGDTLVDALSGDFDGIGDSFSKLIQRMLAESAAAKIMDSLFGAVGAGGKRSSDGLLTSFLAGIFPSANGNVFPSSPGISAYSSSIVSKPTLFPFAKGVGLMGEAGAEAIMPLRRDGAGRLGVSAAGASVVVNVINQSGQQVGASQSSRRGSDGSQIVDVVLSAIGDSLANRSGPVARGLESGYGLRPAMA